MGGSFERRVEFDFNALAPFRHTLDGWLESRGLEDPPRAAVVLATHEALANAIEHSHSPNPVLVTAEVRSNGVVIEIADDGSWRVPHATPNVERGRGLDMIRKLVSDLQINREPQGTTVRLFQRR